MAFHSNKNTMAENKKENFSNSGIKANSANRLPPQNIEAEQSILGSLMLSKEAIIKIADLVKPKDFYHPAHEIIYETIIDLYENREPIDLLSLSNRLKEKGKLEEIGGQSYLTTLVNSVPTAAHIDHYGKIVQKKSTLRRLIDAASQIVNLGYDEEKEADVLLDQAEQKIFNVSQNYLHQDFSPIKPILEEAFDRIDELHKNKGKLRGLPTGFYELDNILAGLQNSNLIILAARPSLGKTSLAMDIARNVATREKIPVGIFSLEMSQEELIDRLLCSQANIDLWKLRTGRLSSEGENDDFSRIGQAMGILSEAPIFIDDAASSSIMEMRTMARRLQAERGLGLIIVDYIQMMKSQSSIENRVQEISEISRLDLINTKTFDEREAERIVGIFKTGRLAPFSAAVQQKLTKDLLLAVHSKYKSRSDVLCLTGWMQTGMVPTGFDNSGVKGDDLTWVNWEISVKT